MKEELIHLKNMSVAIDTKGEKTKHLIRGIDLSVPRGEIVGVVGESGSGKSITMKALMNLLPENATVSYDTFLFDGQEHPLGGNGPTISAAMIFQDPMTSLNPLRTIGYHLIEVVRRKQGVSKKEAETLAIKELIKVGIHLPEKRMTQYPHELSGGMRQRIMIAMALLAKADLLIADEPTTALDVTIQAQILQLIKQLQQEENLTVILVTHDFGIVAGMCDSIKVMYNGKIVEEGLIDEVFYQPQHRYTQELLKAIPNGTSNERLYSLDETRRVTLSDEAKEMRKVSDTHFVLVEGDSKND